MKDLDVNLHGNTCAAWVSQTSLLDAEVPYIKQPSMYTKPTYHFWWAFHELVIPNAMHG